MHPKESLKDRFLGEEVNLPVGILSEKEPVEVLYTYYVGKPESHRLEFQKKGRTKFEIFLPQHGKNLSEICAMETSLKEREDEWKSQPGFMIRALLFFKAGSTAGCRELFVGPVNEFRVKGFEAASVYRYRLVLCVKGGKESVAFISSRHGRQSGPFKKESSEQLNWLIINREAFAELEQILRRFLESPEFRRIETNH